MITTLFGKELKALRLALNLSQEALARKVGTHKGYVCGIERGSVNPPAPRITVKMAKALGADPKRMLKLAWVDKAPKLIRDEVRAAVLG